MNKEILGKGWSFPPRFDRQSGGVVMETEESNVAKCIRIIVLTRLGERMFHPSLGTDIQDFLFTRNINTAELRQLKDMILYAIIENEDRVNVDKVEVEPNHRTDALDIAVTYTIKATQSRYNMVLPFYLEPGAGL